MPDTSVLRMWPVPPSRNGPISTCAGQWWCGAPRRNRTADPILTMNPGSSAVLPSVFAGHREPSRVKLCAQFAGPVRRSAVSIIRDSSRTLSRGSLLPTRDSTGASLGGRIRWVRGQGDGYGVMVAYCWCSHTAGGRADSRAASGLYQSI